MMRFALDGDWQLWYFPEGQRTIAHPDALQTVGVTPIPARVPGNVELDLQRAGLIPDPFYADNIRALRPFESYEWWYTREFVMPESAGQCWDLVCEGLDTLATIWINGFQIGQAANMLIEHRFDVTKVLRPGQVNHIAIRLNSAVNHARSFRFDAGVMSWEHREEGLFIRKAPHVWGWDIMPRAVSAGIWRSIYVENHPATAIEQLYYWTADVGSQGATLGVRFQFRMDGPLDDGLALHFHGACADHTFDWDWPVEFIAGGCRIPVPGARLWWPKAYGEPDLYTVTAHLHRRGEILAERVERIGLCKLVVQRTNRATTAWSPPPAAHDLSRQDKLPDPDSHLIFYVNGEPIMIKGSNWVPLDAFHSRDAQRLEQALALLDDLGCNMIRCWGGNVYEGARFFEACDEKGILVWQDLAFACCRYPQTDEFMAQVREETRSVVEKLRNHPSLAIWCGDNEVDMTYAADGLSPEGNRLTREVIPRVLQSSDPYRAYVPSSPYLPPAVGNDPNAGECAPEQHLWGPRGYYKSPFYAQHSAHFLGEIGYHGCPNVSSIRRFISPGRWWPWQDNDEWQTHAVYHWRHPAVDRDRVKLMANQMRELFGIVPDDLETFALASQIAQAEAVKFFIEAARLRKWHTSGILWWNLLDGWPQFSDAVVDYYFAPKLAYYYIRRVQQPVCLILGEPGPDKYLPVVISNDSLRPAHVQYRVQRAGGGETLVAGTFTVPANQNWQVDRIRTYAGEQQLALMTWEVEGRTFGNHYLAGYPPVSLTRYTHWLGEIATLPQSFDATAIAR